MLGPCLRIDRGRVGKELGDGMGVFTVVAARMVVCGFLEGGVVVE